MTGKEYEGIMKLTILLPAIFIAGTFQSVRNQDIAIKVGGVADSHLHQPYR